MGPVTQEDPIGIAGGLNLYGYANGDPINFSDPFGLCGKKDEEPCTRKDVIKAGVLLAGAVALPADGIAGDVAAAGNFVAKLAAAAGAGAAVGAAANALEGGGSSPDPMVTVLHFTSVDGAAQIQGSGYLRSLSFVTLPGQVSGLSPSGIEAALEIGPGRGAMMGIFQTQRSNLLPALNGTLTSGGRLQFQIARPIPAAMGTFVPTGRE